MKRRSAAPLAVLQAVARRVPLLAGLRIVDALGRAYARVTLARGRSLDPWRVEQFPTEVAELFGPEAPAGAPRALIEARLAFVLSHWLVRRAIRTDPRRAARALLPRIDVRGVQHLASALDRGRGAVVISTHFGFPHLIRMVLAERGIPMVTAVAVPPKSDRYVQVTGDGWSRARGLLRIREELSRNGVAVVLPDYTSGTTVEVPLLRTTVELGVGAFHIARATGCALVPFFAAAERPARFGLQFSAALRSPRGSPREAIREDMAEFAARYADCVERYPAQLPYRRRRARPAEEAREPGRGASVSQ